MIATLLSYVGPPSVTARWVGANVGTAIHSRADLDRWLAGRHHVVATYVVDAGVGLRLADRHAEHVACADGEPVLAAGELTISDGRVVAASNQSTGYCPPADTWRALARALDRIPVERPGGWTLCCEFARCTDCGQLVILKDGIDDCPVCEAALERVR